jgi:MtN3 and saliva related transmembrane protein
MLDWVGYAAGVCTTLAFLPQAVRVLRTRSVEDISLAMYIVYIAGVAMWLAYGLVLNAGPIVIANAVSLLLAGSILVMKLRFREAPQPA